MQDVFTTGTCCRNSADFSWQAKQICSFGMSRFKVVMSPWVLATWHTVHEVDMAECTDFPLIFFMWQVEQSASTGRTPGCSTPHAGLAAASSRRKAIRVIDSCFINVASFYSAADARSLP